MRDTKTTGCSHQKKVSFQLPAVTFSERTPTTNPFLTKIKKSDDQNVQRIRHKHGRRSYLSVGVGSNSQSLLEWDPTRSKDRALLSYNTYITVYMYIYIYLHTHTHSHTLLCSTNTHTHTRTHAHTHAHKPTHTHTRTHAHTRTHMHINYIRSENPCKKQCRINGQDPS